MEESSAIHNNEELVKDRRDKVRKDIILLACKLFINKGYDRTSLRELAKAFGLSKGGLYHYIGSKEDILRMIIRFTASGENQYLDEMERHAVSLSPTEAIRYSIERNIKFMDEYQDMYVFIGHISVNLSRSQRQNLFDAFRRVAEHWENLLVRGVEAGEFIVEDPKSIAFFIIHLNTAWAHRRWYLRKLYTMEEYTQSVTDLVLSKIRTETDKVTVNIKGKRGNRLQAY
jgi:AcrR family transcriptional regulator